MDQIDKIFAQCYQAAPTHVQQAVDGFLDKPAVVEYIARKNDVPIEKIPDLQTEILLTFLGIEPISLFRSNLTNHIGVTYNQAIKITTEVNAQIFGAEVSATLKKLEETPSEQGAAFAQTEVNSSPAVTQKVTPVITAQHAPNNLIPDHEQMTRTDGPHLHSQKTMPLSSQTATATFTQAAPAQPLPTKSVVDQKLGGMVRSASSIFGFREVKDNTPTQPLKSVEAAKSAPANYNGNDPYREPLI